MRRFQLPLLGSNQDSPDPESGVLPVTPRAGAVKVKPGLGVGSGGGRRRRETEGTGGGENNRSPPIVSLLNQELSIARPPSPQATKSPRAD